MPKVDEAVLDDAKLDAQSLKEEKKKLKKEKKEADKRAKELEEYEEYVKTDEYVEEVAREKLGLVYKDEIIFEPDNDD